MMRKLSLWLPVVLWAGLIFYFSSVPGLRITEEWYDIILRKLAHLFVFGVMALPLHRTGMSMRRAFLFTILYAISDEAHQHFVPGRHAAALDVLIDTAGAALALRLKSCYT